MNKVIIMAAAAVLSLSSCSLRSKYESVTEVDSSLYGVECAVSENAATVGDANWADIFTEPLLAGYISQALGSNSDLRSAELRVDQAAASLKAARLAYLPSVSLAPEGSISSIVGTASYESYSIPVAASWEVDLFGRVSNSKLKSKMQLEQMEYTSQAVKTEVVAGVANIYYTIAMLQKQLEIARATEQSWQESYRVAQAMMEAGMMNQAGISQIEAGLYSVQISVVGLEDNLNAAQNALCSLVAIPSQSVEVGELSGAALPDGLGIGVPLQMLSARPDVMAVEAALAASFYSKNVARSSMYPSLTLSGSLGWSNSFGSMVLDPAELIGAVVGQLVQPIFNKGLNRAAVKVAEADLEIARIAFEQTLLDAGIEVNEALVALESAQKNTALYSSQVAALKSAAANTELMMENGSTTYLEVLTAQQSYFNAQLGEVANKYAELQSVIALYKSLGGGRF